MLPHNCRPSCDDSGNYYDYDWNDDAGDDDDETDTVDESADNSCACHTHLMESDTGSWKTCRHRPRNGYMKRM